jgi:quercetin dioxygenase-like cupin family protein
VATHDVARFIISLAVGASVAACGRSVDPTTPSQPSSVTRATSIAAADVFPGKYTGNATATPFLNPTEGLAASAALLVFDPGARTAWHSHPAGQTLFVTSGRGSIQEWGGKKIQIEVGDVIWTPPGVKHWHGGTATTAMTHVAIQATVGGEAVEWFELVTDEQYAAP